MLWENFQSRSEKFEKQAKKLRFFWRVLHLKINIYWRQRRLEKSCRVRHQIWIF